MKMALYNVSLFWLLSACGNLQDVSSTSQLVQVIAHGIYKAPVDAVGNAAPKFYEMSLQRLVFVPESGESVEFTPESSETLRVIDRPQNIFEKDIKDYEGDSFKEVQVYFDTAVVVGAKYRDDYALTLPDTSFGQAQDFTVKKGKDLKVNVKIEWQNTVDRDAETETEEISQPNFTISVE